MDQNNNLVASAGYVRSKLSSAGSAYVYTDS
jgi:hypothetical protein